MPAWRAGTPLARHVRFPEAGHGHGHRARLSMDQPTCLRPAAGEGCEGSRAGVEFRDGRAHVSICPRLAARHREIRTDHHRHLRSAAQGRPGRSGAEGDRCGWQGTGHAVVGGAMNSVQTLARTAVLALALLVAACAKQAPADAGAQAVAGLPKWDGYWTSASMRPEIFGFDKEILKGDVRDQKVALEILSKTYPLVGA